MTATDPVGRPVTIPARDGYPLAARVFGAGSGRVAVINGATAVPQRFYRHFAAALAEAGYTAVTYDYRGVELDSVVGLKRLDAGARDWALNDLRSKRQGYWGSLARCEGVPVGLVMAG